MSIRVPVLYGTGAFGDRAETEHTICSINDPEHGEKFIDVLLKHGQVGLDSSNIYGLGASQVLLGRMNLKGARVDTKIFPSSPGDHAPAKFRELFQNTLKVLNSNKIRVFYLHAPDRSVPFEDTLQVVDELYKAGHFEEFGLSNFASWEVAEIVTICKYKGYIRPTVYQGIYNAVERTIETELVPCIRKHGLRLAVYSPLAGGFLVGKFLDGNVDKPGSHFDPKWTFGPFFINRYMSMVPAMQEVKKVVDKHGLTFSEMAVRWLQHHSVLGPEDQGIVFGASKPEQLERTLTDCAKGPLPNEVLEALNEAYDKVKGGLPHYTL